MDLPQKLDFIHGRALIGCFEDPKAVFARAFEALAPGGYLELRDPIFPLQFLDLPPDNSPLVECNKLIIEAAKAGRPWTNAQRYKQLLEEIRFEGVVERRDFGTLSLLAKGEISICQFDCSMRWRLGPGRFLRGF
jgi:hypothetical protein